MAKERLEQREHRKKSLMMGDGDSCWQEHFSDKTGKKVLLPEYIKIILVVVYRSFLLYVTSLSPLEPLRTFEQGICTLGSQNHPLRDNLSPKSHAFFVL